MIRDMMNVRVWIIVAMLFFLVAIVGGVAYVGTQINNASSLVPADSFGPGTLIIDQIQGVGGEFSILYWEYTDDGTRWVTITSKDGLHSWMQELTGGLDLQEAVDKLGERGGTIRIPAGEYPYPNIR